MVLHCTGPAAQKSTQLNSTLGLAVLGRAGKYAKISLTAASKPHLLGNLSCAGSSQGSKGRGGGMSASKELLLCTPPGRRPGTAVGGERARLGGGHSILGLPQDLHVSGPEKSHFKLNSGYYYLLRLKWLICVLNILGP